MTSTPESATCDICCYEFNKSTRKPTSCTFCEFTMCVSCLKQYTLSLFGEPHCMSCKRGFLREHMVAMFPKSFIINEYKRHRENILHEREKCMLPATQARMEIDDEKQKFTALIKTHCDERHKLYEELQNIRYITTKIQNGVYYTYRQTARETTVEEQARISQIYGSLSSLHLVISNLKQQRYRAGISNLGTEQVKDKEERRQFVKKCPGEGCNGFLSTQWKCSLCNLKVCNKCLEVKPEDESADHVCDPENVKTAELINSDSKGCPGCGTRITKLSGCFAEDTPVLTWEGMIKMAQDVKVGDVLIGDDGEKRTVQDICQGIDQLYKISQLNGDDYVVNSKHTLVFKHTGEKTISWIQKEQCWKMNWFDHDVKKRKSKTIRTSDKISKEDALKEMELFKTTLRFPTTIEIMVEDYMKFPASTKTMLKGYKSRGVNWPYQHVDVDPYMIGLWIGDGINNGMEFAADGDADPEIIHYLIDWCNKNDAELVHDAAYKFRVRRRMHSNGRKAMARGSSCETCKGCEFKKCVLCDLPDQCCVEEITYTLQTNPLKALLDKYNMVKNKHIPEEYMVNSREVRLGVLAGLCDSDGCSTNNGKRMVINQVNENIAKQISQLARTLGFVVNVTKSEHKNVKWPGQEAKDYADIYAINLSGEFLYEIPTKLPRKKCVGTLSNKDYMRTNIEVVPVHVGTYYGWRLDGNHRFVAPDFTVYKNCSQMWCPQCHVAFDWRTLRIVTGVVHNPHYYEYQRSINGGVAPRTPGDIPGGGCDHQVPSVWSCSQIWNRHGVDRKLAKYMSDLHRLMVHIQHQEIPALPTGYNARENEDVRRRFLRNHIDEARLRWFLQKREKLNSKKREVRQLYEMFVACCQDFIRKSVLENINNEEFMSILDQFKSLCKYFEESAYKIYETYGGVVPYISFAENTEYDHGASWCVLVSRYV